MRKSAENEKEKNIAADSVRLGRKSKPGFETERVRGKTMYRTDEDRCDPRRITRRIREQAGKQSDSQTDRNKYHPVGSGSNMVAVMAERRNRTRE